MDEIAIRYFHFLGILCLTGALVVEHVTLASEIGQQQLRRLVIVDAIYGVSAGVVLLAGLALWLWVGKPAAFYTESWVFHLKLSVFFAVALLSLYPTIFFIRNRKNKADVISIPTSIIVIVRIELVLLAMMPLFAVLMARGYGL